MVFLGCCQISLVQTVLLLEIFPPQILKLWGQLRLLKIGKMVNQRSKLARINEGHVHIEQRTQENKCGKSTTQLVTTKPSVEKRIALQIHII